MISRMAYGLRWHLPQAGIAFAITVVVWLAYYFRFPNAPLTEIEFLVAFVLAYLCVAGARWLIARRHGQRTAVETIHKGGEPETARQRPSPPVNERAPEGEPSSEIKR